MGTRRLSGIFGSKTRIDIFMSETFITNVRSNTYNSKNSIVLMSSPTQMKKFCTHQNCSFGALLVTLMLASVLPLTCCKNNTFEASSYTTTISASSSIGRMVTQMTTSEIPASFNQHNRHQKYHPLQQDRLDSSQYQEQRLHLEQKQSKHRMLQIANTDRSNGNNVTNRDYPIGDVVSRKSNTSTTASNSSIKSICPEDTEDSIYHCLDPSQVPSGVVCEITTCLWRIKHFTPTNQPRYCKYIDVSPFIAIQSTTKDNINSTGNSTAATIFINLPDDLEPCVLWEIKFGFLAPSTASPMSTNVVISSYPSASPSTKVMTNAPVVMMVNSKTSTPSLANGKPTGSIDSPDDDAFGLSIPFKDVLLNYMLDSNQIVDIDLSILSKVTSRHIADAIRIQLGPKHSNLFYEVYNVSTKHVSSYKDWAEVNHTVLQTYSHTGLILLDQSFREYYEQQYNNSKRSNKRSTNTDHSASKRPSIKSAVNEMVQQAFQDTHNRDIYVSLLQISRDAGLRLTLDVYLGNPSDLIHSNGTLPITSTIKDGRKFDTDSEVSSSSSPIVKWGDWSDPIMIAIVAGSGAAALGTLIFVVLMCCCRPNKKKKNTSRFQGNDASGDDTNKKITEAKRPNKNKQKKNLTPRTDNTDEEDDEAFLSPAKSANSLISSSNSSSPDNCYLKKKKNNAFQQENYGSSPKKSSPFHGSSMKTILMDSIVQKDKVDEKKNTKSSGVGSNPSAYMELYDIEEASYSKSDTTTGQNLPSSSNTSFDAAVSEASSVYSYLESNTLQSMIHDEAYYTANVGYKDTQGVCGDGNDEDDGTRDGAWSVENGDALSFSILLSPNRGFQDDNELPTTPPKQREEKGLHVDTTVGNEEVNIYPSPALFEVECKHRDENSIHGRTSELNVHDNDTVTTLGNDTAEYGHLPNEVTRAYSSDVKSTSATNRNGSGGSRYTAIIDNIVGEIPHNDATKQLSLTYDNSNIAYDNDESDNDDDSKKPTQMIYTTNKSTSRSVTVEMKSSSDRLVVFQDTTTHSTRGVNALEDDNLSLISGLDVPTVCAGIEEEEIDILHGDQRNLHRQLRHMGSSLSNAGSESNPLINSQPPPTQQKLRGIDPPPAARPCSPCDSSESSSLVGESSSIKIDTNQSIVDFLGGVTDNDSVASANVSELYNHRPLEVYNTKDKRNGDKSSFLWRGIAAPPGRVNYTSDCSSAYGSNESRSHSILFEPLQAASIESNDLSDTNSTHSKYDHDILENSLASSSVNNSIPLKKNVNEEIKPITIGLKLDSLSATMSAIVMSEPSVESDAENLPTRNQLDENVLSVAKSSRTSSFIVRSNPLKYNSKDIDATPKATTTPASGNSLKNLHDSQTNGGGGGVGEKDSCSVANNSVASSSLQSASETDSDSFLNTPNEVIRATVAERRIAASALAFGSVRKSRNVSLSRRGSKNLHPVNEAPMNIVSNSISVPSTNTLVRESINSSIVNNLAPSPPVLPRYLPTTSSSQQAGEGTDAFGSCSTLVRNDNSDYASESDIQSVDDDQRSLYSASASRSGILGHQSNNITCNMDNTSSKSIGNNSRIITKPSAKASMTGESTSSTMTDEFRFGPLSRGGSVLTDQERKHLGYNRSKNGMNDSQNITDYNDEDDDDVEDSTRSHIVLPSAYNSPIKSTNSSNHINEIASNNAEHMFVSMLMVDSNNNNFTRHNQCTEMEDDLSSTGGSVATANRTSNYPDDSMASF